MRISNMVQHLFWITCPCTHNNLAGPQLIVAPCFIIREAFYTQMSSLSPIFVVNLVTLKS